MTEIMTDFDVNDTQFRDLALLQHIEADPDISQAKLAEKLGVAIGTVNWYLKRMLDKGLIKVKRAQRRKLRYIITPEGLNLRAKLTLDYIQQSFNLFREMRQKVRALLDDLQLHGENAVRLVGDGDIAEVCRLTCLEKHFFLTENLDAPTLVIDGLDIRLEFKDNNKGK
jgi:DNA-binding MarR family transcriptional regulator